MTHSFSGSIPGTHREIWVDTAFTHSQPHGFLEERSSTELLTDAWPSGLKRKTEIFSAE